MNDVYRYGAATVSLLPDWDPGVHYITEVRTKPGHRNRGHATLALARVVEDAVAEGARLFLVVDPDGDTDENRLRALYTRAGFRVASEQEAAALRTVTGGYAMIWEPH